MNSKVRLAITAIATLVIVASLVIITKPESAKKPVVTETQPETKQGSVEVTGHGVNLILE